MKVAALDLGSNTSLLLIAEVQLLPKPSISKVFVDRATVTRLGQGVNQTHRLKPEALERAEKCFKDYSSQIKSLSCEKIVAVATSAARDAENGDKFFELAQKYDIPLHIISGDEEAQMTFLGSTFDLEPSENYVVIDVGGGSTEIIGQKSKGTVRGKSLNVGSVRLQEMFVDAHPAEPALVRKIEDYIEKVFNQHKGFLPFSENSEIVAVAGTPTTLAALDQGVSFAENLIHGYELSVDKLREWRNRLAKMSLAERLELPGMQPGREDVIVVGTTILLKLAELLGADGVKVSTKGVRYGLALQYENY